MSEPYPVAPADDGGSGAALSRRRVVVGAGLGLGGLAAASMARPDLALAARTGEYNVKDSPYNATGNGTTDDTSAIQSAINDAGTAGGGVVFFPKGTYAIAGAGGTGLTAADNVTLEGAG